MGRTISKAELYKKGHTVNCWDYKGVLYFEQLSRNQTINSDVDCQQLMKLGEVIKEKRLELASRMGILFQYDNARPHTFSLTREKKYWSLVGK